MNTSPAIIITAAAGGRLHTGQLWVVGIIVALAVAYSLVLIVRAFRRLNDPCHGCQGCPLKEQRQAARGFSHKKPPCEDKKNRKKFGDFK